jgi:hypothetical protein
MESTWETRDLVVLESIVRLLDGPGYLQVLTGSLVIEDTGLSNEDVGRALLALNGPYIDLQMVMSGGDAGYWMVRSVTPLARLTVGQWPTPEQLAERITRALDVAADGEKDEEKRSRLKSMAIWAGSAGKDVVVQVLASVIAKQSGLG